MPFPCTRQLRTDELRRHRMSVASAAIYRLARSSRLFSYTIPCRLHRDTRCARARACMCVCTCVRVCMRAPVRRSRSAHRDEVCLSLNVPPSRSRLIARTTKMKAKSTVTTNARSPRVRDREIGNPKSRRENSARPGTRES